MAGKVKETTQNLVIPGAVALGLFALIGQAIGLIPDLSKAREEDGFRTRLIAVEARQVDMERQWRADRTEVLFLLMELKASIARIEGKLEK